jgi:hypothetical protein
VTDRDRPLVDPDRPETWPGRLTEVMQRVDDVVSAAEYAHRVGKIGQRSS